MCAVVCVIALTAISLTPHHGHRQQRICDICNAAHLPLLQAVEPVSLTAPSIAVFEYAPQPVERTIDCSLGSADDRAPPSGF